jgi:hypothetical protein
LDGRAAGGDGIGGVRESESGIRESERNQRAGPDSYMGSLTGGMWFHHPELLGPPGLDWGFAAQCKNRGNAFIIIIYYT